MNKGQRTKDEGPIKNYAEFWDFYVQEHSQPLTRLFHFVGTALSIVMLIWFIRNGTLLYSPMCLVVGYGFAWFSHFFIEHNKPATFQYPLWSFISDYKMMFYMLTGKMNSEVERVSRKKLTGMEGIDRDKNSRQR